MQATAKVYTAILRSFCKEPHPSERNNSITLPPGQSTHRTVFAFDRRTQEEHSSTQSRVCDGENADDSPSICRDSPSSPSSSMCCCCCSFYQSVAHRRWHLSTSKSRGCLVNRVGSELDEDAFSPFDLLAKRYFADCRQRSTLESNYKTTTDTICCQERILLRCPFDTY